MRLRVPASASDEEIQSALHQLFSQSVQGHQGHNQCPQGNSVLADQCPHGKSKITNDDQAPIQDNFEVKPIVIAPTVVSKLQLDNSF